jgi:hypothetical protein
MASATLVPLNMSMEMLNLAEMDEEDAVTSVTENDEDDTL